MVNEGTDVEGSVEPEITILPIGEEESFINDPDEVYEVPDETGFYYPEDPVYYPEDPEILYLPDEVPNKEEFDNREPQIADETGYYPEDPYVYSDPIYYPEQPLSDGEKDLPTEQDVQEKAIEVKEKIEDFVQGFLDEDGECGCVDEENCLETVEVLIDCVDGECTATLVTETDIDFDAKLKLTAIPDPLLNGECCG